MTGHVGIDLGTTYSVVAHAGADGRPEIIADSGGELLTPSVVSFTGPAPLVGQAAKAAQAAGETEVASLFKRSMGDASFLLTFAGRDYDATALSALVLAHLKRQAEQALGHQVTQAVITVPAYFTHPQRAATIQAGEQAGLEVLTIISEPTAAALAYGLRPGAASRRVLVYDLGGGTFDVSLVEVATQGLRVIGTGGDHRLGGRDWDDRLAIALQQRFMEEFGLDILDDPDGEGDVGALLERVEQLKHTLSARRSADIEVTAGGHAARYTVTRQEFDDATRDLLERTQQLTTQVLADAGVTWEQLDGVVPVGGSTRMPMVREWVQRMSGRPPLGGAHPDQAVALGAAIQAAAEVAERAALRVGPAAAEPEPRLRLARRVQDVIAHSLGMIAENDDHSRYVNSVLIRKNLPIPASEQRPFQFRLSGDRARDQMEVYLTQGETDDPQECAYLGRYLATGFTGAAGTMVVDVTYAYDRNGVVHVAATERATGTPLDLTVEDLPSDVPERFLGRPVTGGAREHATVYLAFDLSGSMSGQPLAEAKRAAHAFVSQCDLTRTSVGLIGFSDAVHVQQPATQNHTRITAAVDSLRTGLTGYSNAGDPFDEIHRLLDDASGGRYAIVLADGVWSRQDLAVKRAHRCHQAGIEVVAIGFGSADERFLERIASSTEQSLFTDLNRLTDAFSTIAQELTEGRGGRVGTGARRFQA